MNAETQHPISCVVDMLMGLISQDHETAYVFFPSYVLLSTTMTDNTRQVQPFATVLECLASVVVGPADLVKRK
jgi:hypothetical protein